MEVLARDLSLLDGENVQSVLASDVDVLMEQLEIAINEADKIEKRLDSYDEKLSHIRDTMEAMGKKTTTISIVNKNNLLLYKELEKIVVSVKFLYVTPTSRINLRKLLFLLLPSTKISW